MAARTDPLDKAIAAKERCEKAGHPVRKIVLDGRRIEIEFATGPIADDFDLLDFKR